MAQGVAKQAQRLNVACTVVVPDQAPEAKLEPVRRMGGKVIKVPFEEWWEIIQVRDILLHTALLRACSTNTASHCIHASHFIDW
jgi:cysteine synthase